MKQAEIRDLAEQVLSRVLPAAPFEGVTAELRPNHADEDSIFITVHYRPGVGGTAGRVTGDALVALRDALRERGEERFPYLTYVYPDDPPPSVDELDAAE